MGRDRFAGCIELTEDSPTEQQKVRDRILFSNDYPYEDYAEGGEFIDTVPISESDRRKIAYDKAKALYML